MEGDEEEDIPIEYKVEMFAGQADPELSVSTFGGWNIEGDFICVYDQNGLKTCYRIGNFITYIGTTELPVPTMPLLDDAGYLEEDIANDGEGGIIELGATSGDITRDLQVQDPTVEKDGTHATA
jgi:hypothetical protein